MDIKIHIRITGKGSSKMKNGFKHWKKRISKMAGNH